MESAINNSKVLVAQTLYAKSRLRRLRNLYIRLAICLMVSVFIIGVHYIEFENIEVHSFYSPFELPALWLFCIAIQFVFFYADKIPLLKKWQQSLLQKTFLKERNSFENRFFSKSERR